MVNGKTEFGPDWNSVVLTIKSAARHIEDMCPRPGPYHPAFVALLELADHIKRSTHGPG